MTGSTSKTYDGTTNAMLGGGNYLLTGVISGDAVALNDPASGQYGSKNVGTGILVTANGLAPSNPKESGIYTTLPPGTYTAVLEGASATTGIGLIEVYNLQ